MMETVDRRVASRSAEVMPNSFELHASPSMGVMRLESWRVVIWDS